MGPRLLSRGDRKLAAERDAARRLQWGHGFSAVEIWRTDKEWERVVLLQWGHGFSAVEMRSRLFSSRRG